MQADQLTWNGVSGWLAQGAIPDTANLVLYFGTRSALENGQRYGELRDMFPGAHVIGCSTGGQIAKSDIISDDDIAAVALSFDRTRLKLATAPATNSAASRNCGETIGKALAAPDLAGIFILSDGLNVNGSALVAGITAIVGAKVPVTGGLAGDGALFTETLVGGDCAPKKQMVAAIGFYGNAIRIGHGNAGGWDEFGPRRSITRAQGNVLFELDGAPALDLYKRYLGEEASGLPGTALLFPLRIFDPRQPERDLVRTVLSVDHDKKSMTFAGDMPEGWVSQLMRGNFTRLATGAAVAARQSVAAFTEKPGADSVAILVSCIGRRLLMGQRTAEEVEAVGNELGAAMPTLGFYSYGEISPHGPSGICQLHNQTMTVTTFTETAQ
jgi:hypothetical protein